MRSPESYEERGAGADAEASGEDSAKRTRGPHRCVFDDYLSSTTTVFTSDAHAEWLGAQCRLAIHCLLDRQNAAGGVLVQVQHSNDGIHWLPKYGGLGEVSTPSNVPSSGTASLAGFDQGATPSFRFVRIAVTLVSPCTAAHVKLIVSGRPYAHET